MAKIEAEVSTAIAESFRTAQVRGMFDLPAGKTSGESFSVEVPGVEEDWQIGLIVGPSGSGKSTIAKKAFGACAWSSFDWPRDVAVVDGFAGGVDMRQNHNPAKSPIAGEAHLRGDGRKRHRSSTRYPHVKSASARHTAAQIVMTLKHRPNPLAAALNGDFQLGPTK